MGTLYIVATPIGNLDDLSPRALETLKGAHRIMCEDTRVTRKLLARFEVHTPVYAYHQHSSGRATETIIRALKNGENIAYVSDAGTPGVADPGGKLVIAAAKAGVAIVPVPGPSALISALSVCGFAADAFVFLGWPPHKKGRQTWFAQLTAEHRVIVFYESVHRIIDALERLEFAAAERRIMVARELTKKFETIYRGTATEIKERIAVERKGEFVIILDRQQ